MTYCRYVLVLVVMMLGFLSSTQAAVIKEPEAQDWSFQGLFGRYDQAAARRGFQVYQEVCSACHSMDYLHYRDLSSLGFSDDMIAVLAAQKIITFTDDEGNQAERPAKIFDRFVAPFANEAQARAANGGAWPPDLSLIIKARHFGPDYVDALLQGYQDAPAGFDLADGLYYNPYAAGEQFSMPPPLSAEMVEYTDGTVATMAQMSYDVTTFLSWAADPKMEMRKSLGLKVIIALLILTLLLYAIKVRVWRDVEK